MAVIQVAKDELDSWLQAQPENTPETPYEIEVTGLVVADFPEQTTFLTPQQNPITLALRNNLTKYVDLSPSSIPSGVDSMEYGFLFCTNIVKPIQMAESVTKVGAMYRGCTALTDMPVFLYQQATRLSACFMDCSSLVNITELPQKASWYGLNSLFSGCTSLVTAPKLPEVSSGYTTANSTFYNCTSLVNAPVLPENVTEVNYCFSGCTSLTHKPIIPASVTSSRDCYKDVTINNWKGSNVQFESFAPQFVSSQTTTFDIWNVDTNKHIYGVDLGNVDTLLLSLDANTTETSYGLKVLNIPQSYLYLLQSKLAQAEDRYVDLRYTTYPYYASIKDQYGLLLLGCENVVYPPVLPEGITDITSAFSGCTNLKEAPTIPSTVLGLASTFYGCESLTSAPTIPSGVTSLANTFSGCTGLSTPPTIPSSVIYLNGTFSGCTSLTETPTIPSGVTSLESTFEGCVLITEAPTIPNSVTNLKNTFKGCVALEEPPAIPSSVTTLEGTFYGCALIEEVELIPSNVTVMKQCFYGCSSLEKIDEFGIALSTITSNEDDFQDMFKGCSSLVQIGYKIDEAEQWHIFRLKFGSSTVEGVIYDKSGVATDINGGSPVSLTKSNLTLPIKTDEVWFPTGYADDDDIDEIIEKVIANKYTYFKKETIPPDKKSMVLWADDPANFKSNVSMDIPVYNTYADAEADLPNLSDGQIIATEQGGEGVVDKVQSGDMRCVTSNAVAKSLSYSTQEVDTGTTWLDGKPIYKKTLVCTTSSTQNLTPDTWVTLSNYFNVSNIQSSIDSIVSNEFLPRKWYSAKANIVKNNGVLQIDVMRGTSVKVDETYLTLFYTKTT